jgi:Protein of unknown function (DUF998)
MINRRTLAAVVTGPLFLAVAAALSAAESDTLRSWGWTALDHHGVPWPSSLTLTSLGWIQAVSFAVTGIAVLALARALGPGLPERRSATLATAGLAVAGVGLLGAALPLDQPSGDPAELGSWIGSWHAAVHGAGFLAAALGGLAAVVGVALAARGVSARLSRLSGLTAAVSALSLAVPGAVGWYLFLGTFFCWTSVLAAGSVERPREAGVDAVA